jgi:hypothetical protein
MGSGVLKAQDIYWVSILLGMAFITGEPGLTIPYQYPHLQRRTPLAGTSFINIWTD